MQLHTISWLVGGCLAGVVCSAQPKKLSGFAELGLGGTTNNTVPFWMRSNQYGSVPLAGASASFISGVHFDYDSSRRKKLDWAAGFEGRVNMGRGSEFILVEGYAKVHAGPFELKAGRSKDIMGLVDSTLSMGAFSVSGNALGIPKISLAVPEFTYLLGGKLFAFKGNFAHGWLGRIEQNDTSFLLPHLFVATFYHQSSLYGRFGKPGWKIKLLGGVNHQVYWNNAAASENGLKGFKTFLYAVTGKTFERFSKVGNHLGSIDLGMTYDFSSFRLFGYRQSFYDEGALSKLANIADGLYGLQYEKLTGTNKKIFLQKVLVEILNTRNQAGYPWSKPTNSGDEDYYNNYLFVNGWSYLGQAVGNAFATVKPFAREYLQEISNEYFVNNRVLAFHLATEWKVNNSSLVTKFSYSKDYGTFGTSEYQLIGPVGFPSGNIFPIVNQFSGLIQWKTWLANQWMLNTTVAVDTGNLLNQSTGASIGLTKYF